MKKFNLIKFVNEMRQIINDQVIFVFFVAKSTIITSIDNENGTKMEIFSLSITGYRKSLPNID